MRYCAAILMWTLVGLSNVLAQANKPSIVFDRNTIDAGTVVQGETVRKVFAFSNKGAAALEIGEIQTT